MFKGAKGFSGFSSFRVGIYFVCLFVVAISGWGLAFLNSKNKQYRFVILAPIFMLSFQLCIYLLDVRQSSVNQFNFKVLVNLIVAGLLVGLYFYGAKKRVH